jgi:hypothetical protein
MRIILYAATACVIAYALKLAVLALLIIATTAIIIGFITRPRELLQGVVLAAFWGLLERYPVQTTGGIMALSLLSWTELAVKKAAAWAKTEEANAGQGTRSS